MSERPPLPWRPVVFATVVAAAVALALHVVSVVTGERTPVEGNVDFNAPRLCLRPRRSACPLRPLRHYASPSLRSSLPRPVCGRTNRWSISSARDAVAKPSSSPAAPIRRSARCCACDNAMPPLSPPMSTCVGRATTACSPWPPQSSMVPRPIIRSSSHHAAPARPACSTWMVNGWPPPTSSRPAAESGRRSGCASRATIRPPSSPRC